MNQSLKVQPHHLQRSAYLYIRQSSMRQVIENVESTKRQYALRSRATALGWRDDQIIVIDNDQGESGASAAWREGFQRLVTDVGMGHAGMVMGLEVSRLARNNVLDDAIRQRLAALTTDFRTLWDDPATANRERKRMLAYIIEDATLIKIPAEGITKIHVRFKGGRSETLETRNPKSSAQQIKTPPEIVELVDGLLDDHVYSEIAATLNQRGFRPGASARPGRAANRFSAKHVAYLMHTYGLRSRYDRLRQRGMLNKKEMADRLGIHEQTVDRWAKFGIIRAHSYNDHGWQLYELLGADIPLKHCSRWDRLVNRATGVQATPQRAVLEQKEV